MRRTTTAGLPLPLSRLRGEAGLSRWPSEGHIKVSHRQPKHLLKDRLKNAHSMTELESPPLYQCICQSHSHNSVVSNAHGTVESACATTPSNLYQLSALLHYTGCLLLHGVCCSFHKILTLESSCTFLPNVI